MSAAIMATRSHGEEQDKARTGLRLKYLDVLLACGAAIVAATLVVAPEQATLQYFALADAPFWKTIGDWQQRALQWTTSATAAAWQSQDAPLFLNGTEIARSKRTVLCSHGATGENSDFSLARIYTGNVRGNGSPEAHQCISIKGNRIESLGSARQVDVSRCKRNNDCFFASLKAGQSIVPGLHDAHGHLLDLGWARSAVDLVGSTSIREVVKRIEDYIRARPDLFADDSQWISGLGWDQTKWDPPVFPTASDLSSSPLLAKRRIVLRRIDVHALWLSQAAMDEMEKAKIIPDKDEEVEGGLVVRDTHGNASGCFIDKAMEFVYKVSPPWTDADRANYLDAAAQELLALGITNVGDAAVDLETLRFFASREDGEVGLPLRINAFLACPPDQARCADLARRHNFPRIAEPFTSNRLTVRTVKLFADGALGSWGSAMWQPYSDRLEDQWRGLMLIPENEIEPLIRYWVDHGWNVATHCIGDRAQTTTLDAYEKVLKDTDVKDPRFRIEHAQLLRKSDISRFGSLGVIASVQPTHCTSDMGYVEERIGKERASEGAYPWRSLLLSNATLALGSDFPVELPNVMHGIYSAITRKDEHGDSPHGKNGWYPEQRLSRAQALHGFTAAPAYAQFEEETGGTLQKGKRADLAVLNVDVVREYGNGGVTDIGVRNAQVLATFIDGALVWQRQAPR